MRPTEERKARAQGNDALYLATLLVVSVAGLFLMVRGASQLPRGDALLGFLLLLLLAVATQFTATLTIQGLKFSVSTAVSLAAIPLYGPAPAALVQGVAEGVLSLIGPRADEPGWREGVQRLGFNVGMNGIAVFLAGQVFLWLDGQIGTNPPQTLLPLLGFVLTRVAFPWLAAAVVADQVNLWLLILLLYLRDRRPPLRLWREHRWAIPINVAVSGAGGALLALAVSEMSWAGLLVFFVPVVLSAYAFRIYVRHMQRRLGELEELVASRTADLEAANEELAALNEEKDAFLAMLTHDMQAPLTSIGAAASVMLTQGDMQRGQRQRMLRLILRGRDTLLDIVDNILQIAQLQSGAPVELEKERFDLGLAVAEVMPLVEARAAEKGIRLRQRTLGGPVWVTADKEKVQRIVGNLLSNAVKYTEEGGVVLVESWADEERGEAAVRVIDNGVGIPQEELDRIFERYTRVSGHRGMAVGTGLGLAIVKSLVEAHGGTVSVLSREGEGTAFTVRLPLNG